MYSKEEAAKLRQDFWVSFGKSFPHKWILYRTKVKPIQFKFYFDNKKAMVCMDIEGDQQEIEKYYNKFLSLKSILAEFLPEILFEEHYYSENGKEIARIWVEKQGVCIYNKDTWQQAMVFLNEKMQQVECFWQEYEDFFMDDF